MNSNRLAASLGAAFVLTASVSTAALAQAPVCSAPVKVLAQPRDGLTLLEDSKDEFKKLSGASFQIDYLNENDRRAKSRADASTVGNYNVYYVDEANVALFASSGWIVPLTDYYPAEYDYADFDPGRQKVATYDGKVWFAPLTGGGDLMVYRKDVLEAAGIQPPKTLDELIADVPKLTNADKGMYGIALRGARGSGANVWRWMPFFKAYGGKWFDGDKPAFNSDAAVKATETYLKLFKDSAPGTQTGSWDESTGAFLSGQVAVLVESTPLSGMAVDPKTSQVVGKVGFLQPPSPLPGGGGQLADHVGHRDAERADGVHRVGEVGVVAGAHPLAAPDRAPPARSPAGRRRRTSCARGRARSGGSGRTGRRPRHRSPRGTPPS